MVQTSAQEFRQPGRPLGPVLWAVFGAACVGAVFGYLVAAANISAARPQGGNAQPPGPFPPVVALGDGKAVLVGYTDFGGQYGFHYVLKPLSEWH
jgi:hypothetical protein